MPTYSMRQIAANGPAGMTYNPQGQAVGMGTPAAPLTHDQAYVPNANYNAPNPVADNYNAWVAAGKPAVWQGQAVDVRGQPLDPNAWSNMFLNSPVYNPNGANTGLINSTMGSTPTTQGGTMQPGTGTTIGQLASGNMPPPAPPNGSGGLAQGDSGSNPTDPVNGFVNNLTGGANGSGLNVPGGQPNYPLNIGSYLNPMMKYALDNGIQTINNSAAAAGNLNSGNTMKELMDFGTGQASNNFNNAAQIAAGQQAFSYGVDNNDRNFQWNAQNADRNFNLQHDMDLASLGMTGLGQINQNASILAQILSRNIMTGGQAAAGGTIGANNAIVQAIMQALGIGAGNISASGSGG